MSFFGKLFGWGAVGTAAVGIGGGVDALHNAAAVSSKAAAVNSGWFSTFLGGAGHAIAHAAQSFGNFLSTVPHAVEHMVMGASHWGHALGTGIGTHLTVGAGMTGALASACAVIVPAALCVGALLVAKKILKHFNPTGLSAGQDIGPPAQSPTPQRARSNAPEYERPTPGNIPQRAPAAARSY